MSDALATALQQDFLENSLYFAATALCCYDFCLTFGREVQFVWHAKQSMATLLFYCFRYPALLNTIFVVLGYLPWLNWQTTQSCVIIVIFEMAGDILILTSSARTSICSVSIFLLRAQYKTQYLPRCVSMQFRTNVNGNPQSSSR